MKILILSHNCVSTTQNMGKTLCSLFGAFDKNDLVQLYLYPSIPNLDFCKSYYRITDNDIIQSIINRKRCGGIVEPIYINEEFELFESKKIRDQYTRIKRGEYMRFARDIIWKMGAPKSKSLKKWLLLEKPDVVFYALGDAIFSLSLARWISSFLNIPLVTYICDDFYFSGKDKRGIKRFLYNGIIENIKKTVKMSSYLITICDELGEAYKAEFGTPYYTIMTGSSFEIGTIEHREDSRQISYIGNLSFNRWKSLLEIQDALTKINLNRKLKYQIIYYGTENDNLKNRIKYGGYLDANSVKKVMSESLLLIHTETFDKKFRTRLKYSLSTKIADSLASGTCLLVYAPAELVSVKYLIKNGCAFCIVDNEHLQENLIKILDDSSMRNQYAKRGVDIAYQNHNVKTNSKKLKNVFKKILDNRCGEDK